MSDKVDTAVRSLKAVGSEITQWENRLESVRMEVEKNMKTRDALQSEIDKKTSDFGIYISQRDAEVKQGHAELLANRQKFDKDKSEFVEILRSHQEAKSALEREQHELEIQKLKQAASVQNIQEFMTAIRRAAGLLNI